MKKQREIVIADKPRFLDGFRAKYRMKMLLEEMKKDLNRLMDHLGFASAAGLKIIQSIQRVLDFPAAVAI
ncbi:hypothetical protein DM860_016914 [Cuscuta australis]|uniref:Uncharacterized protein n=1 Tax=Cuscuta australis TaxID=267555 RepID=A0A328DXI2_9ASTE|nr:hypothetical protein DM860_016914 [Cuscuta australis]